MYKSCLVLWFALFSTEARAQQTEAATTAKAAVYVRLAGDSTVTDDLGGLTVTEDQATIVVLRGEQPILVYNKLSPTVPTGIDAVYARSGFVHPVYTPSGKVVTATFPADHAHQHGVFSAWVKTTYNGREIDFWNLGGRTGRVLHQRVVETFSRADSSGFEVDLLHQSADEPVVDILKERWRVVVYPNDGNYHCFDIESQQTALTELPLIVQEYHYGGFAVRGPTAWVKEKNLKDLDGQIVKQEESDFLNDRGSQRIEGNHEHARWVSLHGQIEGQPVCITMLSHTDNFRAPQAARLHPTKPYFCFAACVDGEFMIDQQHPLRSRYRYLVTDAQPDAAWIEQQWQAWCGQPR